MEENHITKKFSNTGAHKKLVALACLFLIGIAGILYLIFSGGESDSEGEPRRSGRELACNVQGISLFGELYTYIPVEASADDPEEYQAQYGDAVSSDSIVDMLRYAEEDGSIKAILIEVDSPGGLPVAGEYIASTIAGLTKPVVAVIRQSGMSAAYWAVSSADMVFASRNSDVGSIGVTASYIEMVDQGGRYIDLSSGKFKDTGSSEKPISEEERNLLMRDIKIVHENFIEDIAKYRDLALERVKAIADGSSVLGMRAQELGLIDEIGNSATAEDYIEGIIEEEAEVCW